MLPDYNTCCRRITNYIHVNNIDYTAPLRPHGFRDFWNYKMAIEGVGGSILSNANLQGTALRLQNFLNYYGMGRTGVASGNVIMTILAQIRPCYHAICNIQLGSGQIPHFRQQIEAIYAGLDGITNLKDNPQNRPYGSKSSIVGKSKALMGMWGQTPGFDSVNRKNFRTWTHQPQPLFLPNLRYGQVWHTPFQFYEIIAQLDEWVLKWPANNNGMIFANSFFHLIPQNTHTPIGRIIDMIYNQ